MGGANCAANVRTDHLGTFGALGGQRSNERIHLRQIGVLLQPSSLQSRYLPFSIFPEEYEGIGTDNLLLKKLLQFAEKIEGQQVLGKAQAHDRDRAHIAEID